MVAATPTAYGADLVIRRGDGTLADAVLTRAELDQGSVPENDGRGDASKALAGLWARWMQHAIPRIRSAVLATRPLQPFAHQDEAVFTHMLPQPRLRYLLADEPGTGKTIMTGMYLAEGTPARPAARPHRSWSCPRTWSRNGAATCCATSRSMPGGLTPGDRPRPGRA